MEFQEPDERALIVIAGLPCTGKSVLAHRLGQWANTTVFYIDDFLCAVSLAKGFNVQHPPSLEESERLYEVAFEGMCNAASLEERWSKGFVIIKCRLTFDFEVQQLLTVASLCSADKIIIIECRVKNEYRWRNRVEIDIDRKHWEWYKPGSWMDIDTSKNVGGDDHLRHLLTTDFWPLSDVHVIRRLVLDSFNDLNLHTVEINRPLVEFELSSSLLDAINYFISIKGNEQGPYAGQYVVVQLDDVRRYLLEIKLSAAANSRRSNYLCPGGCIFKYREELIVLEGDEDDYKCGVCDERVAPGHPAYTCYYCILTLHKSCAELDGLEDFYLNYVFFSSPKSETEDLEEVCTVRYACRSCIEGGKEYSGECKSCRFQTILRSRLRPVIVKHECHEHFLSIIYDKDVVCKACGKNSNECSYGCYICGLVYDIRCVSLPVERENVHGGHKHVMKLKYSHRDGMEQGESCWCDFCYTDMDPECWFYSCNECSYYATHTHCVKLSNEDISKGIRKLFPWIR